MSLLTESAEAAIEGDLPPLPVDRWWGDHLREVRWQLELGRLLVDPVFRGVGVPRGDGRPVILMPGLGAGDQTPLVLAAWAAGGSDTGRTCAGSWPTSTALTGQWSESNTDSRPFTPATTAGSR
jgi:hypothetical protein